MTVYAFFVPGQPQGKQRARSRRGFGFYTPAKTVAYENQIRACFLQRYKFWPQLPACVPVGIQIEAVFDSPKRERRAGPVLKKPDADNIAKVVLDALNRHVWADDAQVHNLAISKQYGAAAAGKAGLAITIYARVEGDRS